MATDQIDTAKQVNLVDLVGNRVEMRKCSGGEYEGPCPKCGGDDRFHVKTDGWFCRQCKPIDTVHGWHSSIDFVMWMDGCEFGEAVERLAGGKITQDYARLRADRNNAVTKAQSPKWDVDEAEHTMTVAQARLWDDDGKPAQTYLAGRALQPGTWLAFGLGFEMRYHPDAKEPRPAIAIPWYRGGTLRAIRYRYMDDDVSRLRSFPGSTFAGALYGGQGLWPQGTDKQRLTLILCEGELNAMSVWQVQHDADLDVLCTGSESAAITDAMIKHLRTYRTVIVWMDRPDVVRDLMAKILGAYGVSSPGGKDANDLLQEGKLGAFLTGIRMKAAKGKPERRKVHTVLTNLMRNPNCWDVGTEKMLANVQL